MLFYFRLCFDRNFYTFYGICSNNFVLIFLVDSSNQLINSIHLFAFWNRNASDFLVLRYVTLNQTKFLTVIIRIISFVDSNNSSIDSFFVF